MLTAGREFCSIQIDLGTQLIDKIKRLEILIAPHCENLPPVKAHAVEQPAASVLNYLVDPAIAFALPGKLVNAENACSKLSTPFLVREGACESEINDKVPT